MAKTQIEKLVLFITNEATGVRQEFLAYYTGLLLACDPTN